MAWLTKNCCNFMCSKGFCTCLIMLNISNICSVMRCNPTEFEYNGKLVSKQADTCGFCLIYEIIKTVVTWTVHGKLSLWIFASLWSDLLAAQQLKSLNQTQLSEKINYRRSNPWKIYANRALINWPRYCNRIFSRGKIK